MGDPSKKVQRGAKLRIPAATYNAMLDVVRAHRESELSQEREARLALRQPGIVKIKNMTGAALPRFGVVGLTLPVVGTTNLDRFKNSLAIEAAKPTERRRTAITVEPIPAGAFGHAVVSGVVHCQVDVRHELDDFAAAIEDDVEKLRSAPIGPIQILWQAGAGEVQWALVRVGNANDAGAVVLTTSTITARDGVALGSGTGTVQAISGGTLVNTDYQVTIYNLGTETVEEGKLVQCKSVCGVLLGDWEECDA